MFWGSPTLSHVNLVGSSTLNLLVAQKKRVPWPAKARLTLRGVDRLVMTMLWCERCPQYVFDGTDLPFAKIWCDPCLCYWFFPA